MQSTYLLLAAVTPFVVLDTWYTGTYLFWAMKVSIIAYLFIFVVLPIIFHYSYTFQRKILFLNFVQWPLNVDLTKPESVGLKGARNFYLKTHQDIKIGVWQILPQSLLNDSAIINDDDYDSVLSNAKQPVFLYMHGNSGNRASRHRLELYKLFQTLDYHVICFDYRGYGDSEEAELSEMGVVTDSKYLLEWLLKKVNGSAPVFVWGHSLGTGVSTHVLALLAAENVQPAGLFLESPFNNIAEELSEHPLAQIFKHLPWFHWVIVEPFYNNHLRFESDKHIQNVKCPVMILHAEDDNVVPFSLGEKLYKAAINYHGNNTDRIQFTRINSSYGLGHKYICHYKELPNIIKLFVEKTHKNQTD
ncbi:lysophosphatidylserine lipase ABHD12 isoform X1 [Hylaeus volcanicus]|uniref:lysophosphatidylserine lipase ABHD12 isoform X1 n=2 Tax=Hylaeus volcanicus TaxID=313075 RepID=UPI0023B8218B|nr:lysophosphatidylserine lipase ABHD12 isoform X1 [Hylaeus volcanicus]XP_053991388.1 lysophosphatidylserine lipase ABHD12 isoform X1 [Hylaeus volcanicus]XP_053991396.1 lysophosphatidylserine lipase ABHD12 isoform X1 [Hylaeus volcanicus]XP_053991406.1 lysophosphatidylserine lipase ABHD12 isoform X1 [Hylaeus volcanicus]XP_053991412.1 lysophosphatidylserine lipase ABHD12 isoform X1 [Hylaeus volcanicus]